MRKRSDIDISVWRTHMFDQGKAPLTDSALVPRRGSWGLSSSYRLQTRHNYEISYPYEWGERLDESPLTSCFFWASSQYNGIANPICP